MRTIYAKKPFSLVQRLELKGSLPKEPGSLMFGDLFALEYMGASEFEFGAFSEFLRTADWAANPAKPHFLMRMFESPRPIYWESFSASVGGIAVYGGFDSRLHSVEDVIAKIGEVASGKARCKGGANFPPKEGSISKTVAWVEIIQGVFWSLQDFRYLFSNLVNQSVRHMDKQRVERNKKVATMRQEA